MKTIIPLVLSLTASLATVAHADILAGPITNSANSHVYYVLSSNTWHAAEAEAVALGGHLVTINDAAEQEWVFTNLVSFVTSPASGAWLGFTDYDALGSFHWISGETSSYRNWKGNGPAHESADDRYAAMKPLASGVPGQWVSWSGAMNVPAIVEIIPGPASQMAIGTAVEIAWTSQTTNRYQVQWSSTLDTNDWFNLGPVVDGNGSTSYFFDSLRGGTKKFYRVLTLP